MTCLPAGYFSGLIFSSFFNLSQTGFLASPQPYQASPCLREALAAASARNSLLPCDYLSHPFQDFYLNVILSARSSSVILFILQSTPENDFPLCFIFPPTTYHFQHIICCIVSFPPLKDSRKKVCLPFLSTVIA